VGISFAALLHAAPSTVDHTSLLVAARIYSILW
jgi:hypothetical protein